jgi:hypothetical protein
MAGESRFAVGAVISGGIDALADLASDMNAFALLAAQVKDGGGAALTMGAADADGLNRRGVVAQNVNGGATSQRLSRRAAHLAAGTLRPPEIRTLLIERAANALAQVRRTTHRGPDRDCRFLIGSPEPHTA